MAFNLKYYLVEWNNEDGFDSATIVGKFDDMRTKIDDALKLWHTDKSNELDENPDALYIPDMETTSMSNDGRTLTLDYTAVADAEHGHVWNCRAVPSKMLADLTEGEKRRMNGIVYTTDTKDGEFSNEDDERTTLLTEIKNAAPVFNAFRINNDTDTTDEADTNNTLEQIGSVFGLDKDIVRYSVNGDMELSEILDTDTIIDSDVDKMVNVMMMLHAPVSLINAGIDWHVLKDAELLADNIEGKNGSSLQDWIDAYHPDDNLINYFHDTLWYDTAEHPKDSYSYQELIKHIITKDDNNITQLIQFGFPQILIRNLLSLKKAVNDTKAYTATTDATANVNTADSTVSNDNTSTTEAVKEN